MLVPGVVKRIDDIVDENFTIPQRRAVADDDMDVQVRDVVTYDASHFPLRSALTAEQHQRLDKINVLFDAALSGKRITVQRLRRVLDANRLAEYDKMLEQPVSTLEIIYSNGEPEELRRYKQLVREADFAYWQFDAMSSKRVGSYGKHKSETISRAQNKAYSLYERLQELYECAERGDYGAGKRADFDAWFDREIDGFGVDCNIGAGPVLIPRVRGSKSHNAQDSGLPKLSKRLKQQWAALNVLLVVATDIAFEIPHSDMKTDLSKAMNKRYSRMHNSINPERD
jgi:hypothetical protein